MLRRKAFLALAAMAAIAAPTLAGTTANITITVTVEFLSVNVNPTTVPLGTVAAGATTVGTKLDVTNDGNVAENIGLRILDEDSLDAWTAAATPGVNIYVLFGLIVNDGGAAPSTGNCGVNDVLTTSVKYWGGDGTAAGSQLVTDVNSATAVAAGAGRDLYFGFTAPTSVTGPTAGQQHAITVELSVYKD